ncbi:MAG: hypothetical protein LBS01_01875 [Prevotellaceae bacterium]|jgi:lysophospholipase L1-like esterase|nr:hypothetical protein [Prevotellaceae bacterium]
MKTKINNVNLIKEPDYNFPVQAYRDNIHLNGYGHRKMFEALKDAINPNL